MNGHSMKTLEEIQQALDTHVNTLLGQHSGRIDINEITVDPESGERTAIVTMSGGCRGCAAAKATLKSIVTNSIMETDPTISAVVDSTDHSDKSEAFYRE